MDMEKERIYADELLGKAREAAKAFEAFDQARTDRIVEAVFRAGFDARVELAEAAVEETLLGRVEDKVKKNVFGSLIVYRDIRDEPTVGVIREDPERGIREIARPLGPILNMTPITNPTSTVLNDALISMKTRNPVIFAPHKAARKCTRRAAEICRDAAVAAGAPEHAIQWSTKSKWTYTDAIMRHEDTALVLATSAFPLVKKAYESGHPCLGAGEGNVPVYVDESADLAEAARRIVSSKTFDGSTVCSSEQALVTVEKADEGLRKALEREGAHFCDAEQTRKLGDTVFDPDRGVMRSDVVGQTAGSIARKAGFEVPEGTRLLVAPIDGIGPEIPLSHEILAPVLAYLVAEDEDAALKRCLEVNRYHGLGHTLSIHARDDRVIERFALAVKCGRVLVNTPSSLGGLGGTYNRLHPSLTLSCGTYGGNYTSDNITVRHLMNINRISIPKPDPVWVRIPENAWMDPGFDSRALDGLDS